MKRKIIISSVFVVLLSLIVFYMLYNRNIDIDITSPIYISPNGITISDNGHIFVADETGKRIIRTNDNEMLEYSTSKTVNNIIFANGHLYVLEGGLDGDMVVLDPNTMSKLHTIEVGHTPSGMTVSDDTGYIVNRFSKDVYVIDLTSFNIKNIIPVSGREPVDIVIAEGHLFVSCSLPNSPATDKIVAAQISVIDINSLTEVNIIMLPNGSLGNMDLSLSPDGGTLYVSHMVSRYGVPRTHTDRGWNNTNGFSIIDTAGQELITTVLLDQVESGAANPWGIDVTNDGKYLVVAISGTHEAIIVDLEEVAKRIEEVRNGNGLVSNITQIVDYIPFLNGITQRISLPGTGPRGVAIKDNTAYITQFFSGDIAALDIYTNEINTITLGTQPEADSARRGQILFFDATYTYQTWASCASCHPGARTDGLNWDDNINMGNGNFTNTKSLIYSYQTPPARSTGTSPSAGHVARESFNLINILTAQDFSDLDSFIFSQKAVQSPYLNRDGSLTEQALEGKALFEQSCISCHSLPFYTNGNIMNVGTLSPTNWENRGMNIPTLVEVWRSGPWLHNGSINDMQDIVRHFAPQLNDSEVAALSVYVLSIGSEVDIGEIKDFVEVEYE